MNKQKKSGVLSVVVAIIILIIIVIFSNKSDQNAGFFENATNKIMVPMQNLIVNIKEYINKNDVYFTKVSEMEEKIEELTQENEQLKQENKELENLKTQINLLQDQLNLSEKYGEYKTTPAYIINKDISNYSKIYVINVGSEDGIEPNMTVIADQGLVGHIIEVSENSSKVLPINDASSSVSVNMSTTNDSFVVKGQLDSTSELKATFISTSASVFVGDSLETSGIGGIYPKGIHVGTIKRIVNTSNVIDRYAIVETAVDFDKLTNVLVINS